MNVTKNITFILTLTLKVPANSLFWLFWAACPTHTALLVFMATWNRWLQSQPVKGG